MAGITILRGLLRYKDAQGAWHDLDAIQGPRGEAGARGERGERGPAGPSAIRADRIRVTTSGWADYELLEGGSSVTLKQKTIALPSGMPGRVLGWRLCVLDEGAGPIGSLSNLSQKRAACELIVGVQGDAGGVCLFATAVPQTAFDLMVLSDAGGAG